MRSHLLAAKAWSDGIYEAEITQVDGAELVRDEGIRDDSTVEELAGLRALLAEDGTVTAGNSSPINDGASAVLLGAEGALDTETLARITGHAAHELHRRGGGVAIAAICIGVGQGLAMVLER